jgi:hypothetical protein
MLKDRFDDPFAWVAQVAAKNSDRGLLETVNISERGKLLVASNGYSVHSARIARGTRSSFKDGLFHHRTRERVKISNCSYPDMLKYFAVPEDWQAISLEKYHMMLAWLEGATLAFKKYNSNNCDFAVLYGDAYYDPELVFKACKGLLPAKFVDSKPDLEIGQYTTRDTRHIRMLIARSSCQQEERTAILTDLKTSGPYYYDLNQFLYFIPTE